MTVASWGLFAAGAALAIASRMMTETGFWLGVGIGLLGLSMLIDVLPGGSQLSDEQSALVRHLGFRDPKRTHKRAALLIGAALALLGTWLALG